jgi:hypothetical protein
LASFSESEKKLRRIISNQSFIWNGEKFTTGKAYKPEKKGSGGECKTDCFVIATQVSDKKEHQIKITYKKENASFIENKIRYGRAKTIFGDDWSETIKKQIIQIKKKLQDEPLFYLDRDRKTKKGSIKLGWRYEMEINGTRPLGTPIQQNVARYVWENKNGKQEYRNCSVDGKKITNSGVPNFVFIRNAENFNSIDDVFPNLIPISSVIKNGSITSAFTAQNYNAIRDYQGGGNKRDLSVPIDWSIKNGEITAKLNFEQPLEFNSNIKLEKLRVVLKELDIPVGKRFNVNRFYKKLNPKVIVFPKL